MPRIPSRSDQHSPRRGAPVQSPTILSAADTQANRPGVTHLPPGPEDGKLGVTRVMRRDPFVGETLPAADLITNAHVDLVGTEAPLVGVRMPVTGSSTQGKVAVPDKSQSSRVNVR